MPDFDARIARDGRLQTVRIQASDIAQARRKLLDEHVMVLSIRQRAQIRLPTRKQKFALGLFVQELGVLLEAGLVVVEAVETLRDKATGGVNRDVLTRLLGAMYEGHSFSKALERQPEIFPGLFIAAAASSEHSGQFAAALRRYRQYEAHLDTIRTRVRGALMYPVVVVSIGAAILLFLLFFVIPRFASVFDSAASLPAGARFMVWWGNLVTTSGLVLAAGIGIAIAGTVLLLRTAAVKRQFAGLLWRIPSLAEQRVLFILTRFYRTLGMLLTGGMSAVEATELAGGLLPSDYLPGLDRALTAIKAGQPMSLTFAHHRLTTPVAERLLRVGEQSGEVAAMCERIAQFHDEALERAIELLSKVLGPVLMLVVGGLIGLVVFLLYMPIFELAGSIQG